MDYSALIDRLIERRTALGMDRATFATKMGVSKQKMGHWENKRNRATLEDLESWARTLGLSLLVEVTSDSALQQAVELSHTLEQLPDPRRQCVADLSLLLKNVSERDFRLIQGMLKQFQEDDTSPGEPSHKSAED